MSSLHSSQPSSSSFQNLNPNILITLLIISIAIIISVSLCLLLRLIRHRSSLLRSPIPVYDSRRRVSPEIPKPSLPLFTFSSITRRTSTSSGDCSVCLSKFEPHDQLRLLPLCCHAFHVECIDIWLQSNQTCPLCRSRVYPSESEILKAFESSAVTESAPATTESFRIEIGSISLHRTDSGPDTRRSYSVGSFDYVVEEDAEVTTNQAHRRSVSDKEAFEVNEAQINNLAAEVAAGRSWLRDYVDRLSVSLSSRAQSFRSSGRFFTGSSRRTEFPGVGEYDLEANRIGEDISEFFRWFSGV